MPQPIETFDPRTGTALKRYPTHDPAAVDTILKTARQGYADWRRRPLAERQAVLLRIEAGLKEARDELAALATLEMGKSRPEALAEVDKCAACARFYAEEGPAFLARQEIATDASRSYVAYEPLGPVLAVMPWNFPYWQAFRCLLPALMAGNVVVLKHASNVSGCALAMAEIVTKASGRPDLFQVLLLPGAEAEKIIARPEIAAVSFTGSTPVGRKIAAAAGAALKKCVLELGGSDPYLVLDDADATEAAKICAHSRLLNAGQSCISAKRFIVTPKALPAFREAFVAAMREAKLAPLARADLREELHAQVEKSLSAGARLLLGGRLPAGDGYFYPATVLSAVKPGMPAFDEELFGPVAALIEAADEAEAISLANQTEFGLGAAVFTRDTERGLAIAEKKLEAGSCFVNEFVRSDPRLPFGGVKHSGYGRELAAWGMREFLNVKTVYAGPTQSP